MAFGVFTELWNHHHKLNFRTLHHTQKPISTDSQPPPAQSKHKPASVSTHCPFCPFYIDGITQYVSFCGWVPSLSIMFSRFTQDIPCTKTSFPIVPDPYIRNTPHLLYQFISWRVFGLFPHFGSCEKCCYGHSCARAAWTCLFVSLRLRVDSLDWMVILRVSFWGSAKLFSKEDSPFYLPP